jgi:hypothetical protein
MNCILNVELKVVKGISGKLKSLPSIILLHLLTQMDFIQSVPVEFLGGLDFTVGGKALLGITSTGRGSTCDQENN